MEYILVLTFSNIFVLACMCQCKIMLLLSGVLQIFFGQGGKLVLSLKCLLRYWLRFYEKGLLTCSWGSVSVFGNIYSRTFLLFLFATDV